MDIDNEVVAPSNICLYQEDNPHIFYSVNSSNKIVKVTKRKDGKDTEKIISNYACVTKRFFNVENNQTELELNIFNGCSFITQKFPSSIMTEQGVNELFNYGLRVQKANISDFIQYLMLTEEKAETVYCYQSTGWLQIDNNPAFKLKYLYENGTCIKNYSYVGSLNLSSHGKFSKWADMINTEVVGNTALEFVLMLGFSSPILALLNETNYDLGSIIFNLSNSSSKGKTTSTMLATSVFSNPVCNKGTLITHHATDNALVSMLSNCNGLTIGIDEAAISKHNGNGYSNLLYTICSGCSKLRLNGDSSMKHIQTFSCIVITTAEYDIINDDSPDGIKARVFELTDSLTVSAENSDNIKNAIMNNYGHAGKKFIKALTAYSCSDIIKAYENSKEEITGHIKKIGNLGKRMISKLAVVYLATSLFNIIFSDYFTIDEDKMLNYICSVIERCGVEYSGKERLINAVKSEILNNRYKYERNRLSNLDDCPCAIVSGNGYSDIYITENTFKELMKNSNITNYKRILKDLKQENILICEKDRLVERIRISKAIEQRINCYHFRLINE